MFAVALIALIFPAGSAATHIAHFYNTSRDYRNIASESYPETYPPHGTYSWEWSVPDGHWGIFFLDFHLTCGPNPNKRDQLIITDLNRNEKLQYTCSTTPPVRFFSSRVRVELHAYGEGSPPGRGFKYHVFYGRTKGDVQFKIDDMKAHRKRNAPEEGESSPMSQTVIVLILIIFVLIIAVSIVIVCVLLRRRQHQQTTNTSLHLNIGPIRRESSISYTRNGNGGQGGGRSRMNSEDSLPSDSVPTTPKRPVKRSESNASWAMRAEMATSVRNGSTSSESHHGNTTAQNFYSHVPMNTSACSLGDKGFEPPGNIRCGFGYKGVETAEIASAFVGCRLSTISEESSVTKIRASFPVPVQKETASLAIDNAGYMLMTSSTTNYVNSRVD